MSQFFLASLVCVLSVVVLANAQAPAPPQQAPDIVNDVSNKMQYAKCSESCAKTHPKYEDELHKCKFIKSKDVIVTDCEAECMKLTKEELDNAQVCQCRKGKCETKLEDQKNGASNLNAQMMMMSVSVLPVIFVMKYLQ